MTMTPDQRNKIVAGLAEISAEHRAFAAVDLGNGTVAALVWFGTSQAMAVVTDQLKQLPRVGITMLVHGVTSEEVMEVLSHETIRVQSKESDR